MMRDPETLTLLQDSLRRFVREVLIPAEDEVAEHDAIPPAIIKQMRELGLFGLAIPEAYGRVADRAVQIHGGAGYVAGYAAGRFHRDVRLFRIDEGTSQIQQLVIARHRIRRGRDA